MNHVLSIISIKQVTHDVRQIRLKKPEGYSFIPGHATDVSINLPDWKDEKRPFTFTSLNEDPYLEFTIKCYSDHYGVTNQIGQLKVGDELIIDDPWGAISYKGSGYFIAGGAGITPFIAILRQLHKEGKAKGNKLFFSNKTPKDIIYYEELKEILGDDALFVVTDISDGKYLHGFIDKAFISQYVSDFQSQFYICGPDPMIKAISNILLECGANTNAVTFEK
ncbi:MAG: flavodoxin reductase [Bacteroidetes bacterium]|nr:flavodoxin reductase [Bacteroidota bacterium]